MEAQTAAAEIRAGIGKGALALIQGIELLASNGKQDASSLLKLAHALETAAKVADNLDGLAHVQAVEMAFAKRADAEALAQSLRSIDREPQTGVDDEWRPTGCLTIVD